MAKITLQRTIKESIELEGVGLHNGINAKLILKPAEPNSGIIFKRTDVDSAKNIIEANYKNVSAPIKKPGKKAHILGYANLT